MICLNDKVEIFIQIKEVNDSDPADNFSFLNQKSILSVCAKLMISLLMTNSKSVSENG